MAKAVLVLNGDTKNMLRYTERTDVLPLLGTVYISKAAFDGSWPRTVTVEITPDGTDTRQD